MCPQVSPRSGGPDTGQGTKGGATSTSGGMTSLSPGLAPAGHMLLDDHDAEVSWRDLQKLERDNLPRLDRLKCLVQVRIRVQGPTPQSSMQSEETKSQIRYILFT